MKMIENKTIPPWDKKSPKRKHPAKLTDQEKQEARARAAKAGRRYPNLIDNMAVLRKREKLL